KRRHRHPSKGTGRTYEKPPHVDFVLPDILRRAALGSISSHEYRLAFSGPLDDRPYSRHQCGRTYSLAEELAFVSCDPEHVKFLVLHGLLTCHFSGKASTGKQIPDFA